MNPDIPEFDQSFLPVLDDALELRADQVCTIFGDVRVRRQ